MDLQDGRVVSNFIVQALLNSPITVYGDGTQTRSFCYVDDIIDGILLMMDQNFEMTGPINLGNPTEYTMNELAQLIIDLTNSSSHFLNEILPKDDPKQRRPDISLAKQILNWEPQINLEDGLKRTISEFKSRLN
jgi:UDP-glucuronate decarboxylase